MSESASELHQNLHLLSAKLLEVHAHALDVERQFDPGLQGLELLKRLANDPAWAWLRALSSIIAEIDHVLASGEAITEHEAAAVAARVRGLLFGESDLTDAAFLKRYRSLLPLSPALISAHGEVKRLLERLPTESENESERLHARHVWTMRCEHRLPRVRRPPPRR